MAVHTPDHDRLLALITAEGGATGLDLSGFDFERLDALIDSHPDGLAFTDCLIANTPIRGEGLGGSRWTRCRFPGSDAVGVSLREALFTACTFYDAETRQGFAFRFCDLSLASFAECNMSVTQMRGCTGFGLRFEDCLLQGSTVEATPFSRAVGRRTVNQVSFSRCRMTDAVLDRLDLSSSEWSECSLRNASLRESDLSNAVLRQCDLTGADLDRADLRGCDLRDSTLTGFDLTALKAYAGLTVSADQQHHLLRSLGIEVLP